VVKDIGAAELAGSKVIPQGTGTVG
jgi:hypothetical protein